MRKSVLFTMVMAVVVMVLSVSTATFAEIGERIGKVEKSINTDVYLRNNNTGQVVNISHVQILSSFWQKPQTKTDIEAYNTSVKKTAAAIINSLESHGWKTMTTDEAFANSKDISDTIFIQVGYGSTPSQNHYFTDEGWVNLSFARTIQFGTPSIRFNYDYQDVNKDIWTITKSFLEYNAEILTELANK